MSSDKCWNLSSTKTVLQPAVPGTGEVLMLRQVSNLWTAQDCSKEQVWASHGNVLSHVPLPSKALQNAQSPQAHVQNKPEEGEMFLPECCWFPALTVAPHCTVTCGAAGPVAPQFKQRAAKKAQYSITGIYSIGLGLLIFTRRAHKSIYQLVKVCFLTSKTDGIGQKRLARQTANHGCPLHKITHLSWGMVAL